MLANFGGKFFVLGKGSNCCSFAKVFPLNGMKREKKKVQHQEIEEECDILQLVRYHILLQTTMLGCNERIRTEEIQYSREGNPVKIHIY